MKTLLFRLFIRNWQRKLISLVLAMIIWMMMSHSMTVSKVIPNVSVRLINVPHGKTVEGMQLDGTLSRKLTLTLNGNKSALDEISNRDLEIVLDIQDQPEEWVASLHKKDLVSLNPDFDISQHVFKVLSSEIVIRQTKLMTERIPITIVPPSGSGPKGYQFLDVYPKALFVTVSGAKEDVKKLKTKGLKLAFNLNDIPQEELDSIQNLKSCGDEVSYLVPDAWKKISLPNLSETPIQIDDPQAKCLRIDFSKQDQIPIDFPIPIALFFSPKHSDTLNPETYTLEVNDCVVKKHGLKVLSTPLLAQGVSRLFLETIKNMVQIAIVTSPPSQKKSLSWSIQLMNPNELEDAYVKKGILELTDSDQDLLPRQMEEYLRYRFRKYASQFSLYTPEQKELLLDAELTANSISVTAKAK